MGANEGCLLTYLLTLYVVPYFVERGG